MRISRLLLALALGTALAFSGCGKDSGSPSDSSTAPAPTPTPTATALAPTATPTPSATPTKKPKPTRTPTKASGGSGDADEDDAPATAGGGVCAKLSAAEVGAVLGGKVTGAGLPGGGCSFSQKDPDDPAATVVDTTFADTANGMEGAKNDATSSVEGTPTDLSGVGDEAFVVTGTSFGGDDLQGAGAVRIGDRLISINVGQTTGLPRTKVRALVVGLLRLAVGELS